MSIEGILFMLYRNMKEDCMNLYIDESGSINNNSHNNKYFVIAMVHVINKKNLDRAFKRFVSSNIETLKKLDQGKIDTSTGKVLKPENRMFSDGKFEELKGSQFDRRMKLKFLEFFSREHYFDVYYIKISNSRLTDTFCKNTARVFNYTLRLALEYYIKNGYLPNEDCHLQLDERNEKTESKHFLENYLNTELVLCGVVEGNFTVTYFDSSNNKFIQIADVFANLFYSQLKTNQYLEEFKLLEKDGILKHTFEFPI